MTFLIYSDIKAQEATSQIQSQNQSTNAASSLGSSSMSHSTPLSSSSVSQPPQQPQPTSHMPVYYHAPGSQAPPPYPAPVGVAPSGPFSVPMSSKSSLYRNASKYLEIAQTILFFRSATTTHATTATATNDVRSISLRRSACILHGQSLYDATAAATASSISTSSQIIAMLIKLTPFLVCLLYMLRDLKLMW